MLMYLYEPEPESFELITILNEEPWQVPQHAVTPGISHLFDQMKY